MSSILDNPAIRHAAVPLTVEQYHRLGEAGLIPQRTELLQGVIVEKMIKSPQHSWLVQFLVDWLRANLAEDLHVRQEQPLTFADSEPEPDIAVVAGRPDDYRSAHPTTAILVIEVAVSSAEVDREKANLYAAAAVPEYLIVSPDERHVEVFTHPQPSGYERQQKLGCDAFLALTGLSLPELSLTTLFPD